MNPIVERRALELGEPGRRWLAGLPALVVELARRWSLTVGVPLDGGNAAHVVRAVMSDGRPAVFKLGLPEAAFTPRVRTLVAARGHGYVRVMRRDAGYVVVDPDGFVADPAYDLGVVLRDWCPQLLAGDAVATDDGPIMIAVRGTGPARVQPLHRKR